MLKYFLTVIILVLSAICLSQDSTNFSLHKARVDGYYIKSYFKDTKDLVISPLKWNKREWMGFASFTGGSLLLISNEKPIYEWFQKNRTIVTDDISKYGIEPWGSGMYSMSVMGMFYLHGVFSKNQRSKKVAMLGTKAFLISGIMVHIPKYLFNRHRPYHDIPPDPYLWEGPFTGKYYKSFFSGHTTTIFAVATIVASEYKDKPVVPIVAYTIASAVGISRINDEKHWASDVFAGAIFGYSIGKLIYNKNNWGINITPYSNRESNGLTMTININTAFISE